MAVSGPETWIADDEIRYYYEIRRSLERIKEEGLPDRLSTAQAVADMTGAMKMQSYLAQKIAKQMTEYQNYCGSVWLTTVVQGHRRFVAKVMLTTDGLIAGGLPLEEYLSCEPIKHVELVIEPSNPCSYPSLNQALAKCAMEMWTHRALKVVGEDYRGMIEYDVLKTMELYGHVNDE